MLLKQICETSVIKSKLKTVGYTIIILTLYWFYGNRPLVAHPFQWADEGLYMHQARSILKWLYSGFLGPWLGEYSPYLLSKAPFYPIFLAFINILGIPLRIAEFLGLLSLPYLLRQAWKPLVPKIPFFIFALIIIILISLPQLWFSIRLIRDVLHSILCSFCLISMSGYLLRVGVRTGIKSQSKWAMLTGITFSFCYLNREEVIWLAPIIILSIALGLLYNLKYNKLFYSLIPPALAFAIFIIPILIIAELNYQSYGSFITTIRRSNSLTNMYKCLTSLEPDGHEKYVPITSKTRAKAYQVSPTFAKLGSFLDGPAFDGLASCDAHNQLNDRPIGTREFYVSDFEFALEGAVFLAGANDAGSAEMMFIKITRELKQAIKENKITAGQSSIGLLSAPREGDYYKILYSWMRSGYKLITFKDLKVNNIEFSRGNNFDLIRMTELAQSQMFPTEDYKSISIVYKRSYSQISVVNKLNKILPFIYIIIIFLTVFSLAEVFLKKKINFRWFIIITILILQIMCLMGFTLAMSILDVFGWHHLLWPSGYNSMGFAPLSVVISSSIIIILLRYRNAFEMNY